MRKTAVVLGILGSLFLAAPALANVFVIGPGMIGHPGADDPSVGYSSMQLNEMLIAPDASSTAFAQAPGAPTGLDEAWYLFGQMPGV